MTDEQAARLAVPVTTRLRAEAALRGGKVEVDAITLRILCNRTDRALELDAELSAARREAKRLQPERDRLKEVLAQIADSECLGRDRSELIAWALTMRAAAREAIGWKPEPESETTK